MSRELYNVLVCDKKTGEFIKNNRDKERWLYPINYIVYRNFDKERVQIRHTFHNENEEEVINMLIKKFHDIEFFCKDEEGYGEKHYYWDGKRVLCDERKIWWSPLNKLVFKYLIRDYWYHDYFCVSIENDGRVYLDDYDNNYLKMYKISERNTIILNKKMLEYYKLINDSNLNFYIPREKTDDMVELSFFCDGDEHCVFSEDKESLNELSENNLRFDIFSNQFKELTSFMNNIFKQEKIDIKLVRKMSNSTNYLNKEN